jgi:hypothetical protein
MLAKLLPAGSLGLWLTDKCSSDMNASQYLRQRQYCHQNFCSFVSDFSNFSTGQDNNFKHQKNSSKFCSSRVKAIDTAHFKLNL